MHARLKLPVVGLRMPTTRVTAWVVDTNDDGELVIAAIDGDALVQILVCSRQAAEALLVQLDLVLAGEH